ncbi:MAG TPA: hypothetical protein VFB20_00125 [Burkholderiales bacterium]|nr:hypothetical protein [Burkholderiales bacterium]
MVQAGMARAARASIGVTLSIGLLFALPAGAERNFPPNAQRGEIQAQQYPYYLISQKTYQIAAGGRIYNEQNLIVMPASLPAQTLQVMYMLDFMGQISKIWLLTPEEAKKYPKPKLTDPTRPADGSRG